MDSTTNQTSAAGSPAAPIVSVVVTTRNRPVAMLSRALDAIRRQDLENFEVILMDDGSSAETLAAQSELRAGLDSRFIIDSPPFPGAPGTGPSAAYNRGIRRARGRFVAFCDDDDHWIARDFLRVGVDMLSRHDADLFLGNIQLESGTAISAPGQPSGFATLTAGPRLNDSPPVYEVSLTALMAVMRHYNPSHRSAWMARRGFIESGELFYWERVSCGEDNEWVIRAADQARKILYRADPVTGYNVAPHDCLSSRVTQRERILQHLFVAQHLRTTCSNPSVRSCARSIEAWHLRLLAKHIQQEGRPAAAISLAWQAVCVYPTPGGLADLAKLMMRRD